MRKNNPHIKTNLHISVQDHADIVEMIAGVFFKDIKDDTGETVEILL